jgi:hypothetical protein
LADSKDLAYAAWKRDRFDSFIVEEFVASDLIEIPHLENKPYQPTIRVALLLVYNNHHHGVHFLGEYWKTPHLSVDGEGGFMEKNKDICEPPYYRAVDVKTVKAVQSQLRVTLPLLHSKRLEFHPQAQEKFYATTGNTNLHLVLQEK